MTMPIFLWGSSFGEVQNLSKDHLDRMRKTHIFNLFHMCKVGLLYPTCIRDVLDTPRCLYIGGTWSPFYIDNLWSHFLPYWMVMEHHSWFCVEGFLVQHLCGAFFMKHISVVWHMWVVDLMNNFLVEASYQSSKCHHYLSLFLASL